MRRVIQFLAAGALAAGLSGASLPAHAAGGETPELPDHDWAHTGVFSTFDKGQLKRGFQVFREVCASCHSLQYFAFRNLDALGYSEDEIKEIAAEYMVVDGPDETGEMFEREARPSDYWPSPYRNEEEARYINNGALPPDLSLMVKAREGDVDYLYALLTGYETSMPEDFHLTAGMSYNPYFPGGQIAMPAPLYDEAVEYEDGTEARLAQLAEDVSVFLHWMAEPELDERKQMGVRVLIFLGLFAALMYVIKRRVWSKLH